MADRFNAALRSGLLSVKGKLGVVAPAGKPIAARFNGNVLAGNVRTVDRISGEDFLRWRALAVKQALERDGKVPDAKLFLTAPKLTAEGIKDKGGPNRVDFSIRQ